MSEAPKYARPLPTNGQGLVRAAYRLRVVDAFTQWGPGQPIDRRGITLTANGEPIGFGDIVPPGAVIRATVTRTSTDGALCFPPTLIIEEE